MPFDAGIIDSSPNRRIIHVRYIDSEGKERTDSYDIPTSVVTDAQLNALTQELGNLSNASLFAVGFTNWFATTEGSKADAVDGTNDSIKDNVVILMKQPSSNIAFDLFVPANIEADTMVDGTENPDPSKLSTLIAAAETIWPLYEAKSVRFTERRLKNKSTKL